MKENRREDKTPFVLSQIDWREPRSHDILQCVPDEVWSNTRTRALGRPVVYLSVRNLAKPGHQYGVELWTTPTGEPVAHCGCIAFVVCKHIVEAMVWMRDNQLSFGEAHGHTSFMRGLDRFISCRKALESND